MELLPTPLRHPPHLLTLPADCLTSPRTSSPPTLTYFSPSAGDDQMEMRPTSGAQENFAYGTTLRQHSLPPTLPRGDAFPGRESVRYTVD